MISVLRGLPLRVLPVAVECSALVDEYVRAGIVPARFKNDALHVAVAVWHKLDVIVNWKTLLPQCLLPDWVRLGRRLGRLLRDHHHQDQREGNPR